MALFAIKTQSQNRLDRDVIEKFIDDTTARLKLDNVYKNPFRGRIKKFTKKEIYVIEVNPLVFNFSLFGWPMAVGVFIVFGPTLWVLPGLLLGCAGVFWSRKFFYHFCVKGLRKAGYNGPVVMLKDRDIIRKVVF